MVVMHSLPHYYINCALIRKGGDAYPDKQSKLVSNPKSAMRGKVLAIFQFLLKACGLFARAIL